MLKKENNRKTRLMLNIEKYKGIVLKNLDKCSIDEQLPRKFINGYCKGFNCEGCGERVIKWLLEEYKDPILDDVEREYLSAVIKPFRDMVISVRKYHYDKYYEYITIIYYDASKYLSIYFPPFKKGTMYKGMELDRNYTLEELGL